MRAEEVRPWRRFRSFEGGGIYTAETAEQFFVIIDERTTVDLLSDEDAVGNKPLEVLAFDSIEERTTYLREFIGN